MSRPITQFHGTINRSFALLDMFDERHFDHARGSTKFIQEDDLIRAAVVVAVAAMDHFFTQKFCDVLVPHLKKNGPSDQLSDLLKKSGLDTKTALELLTMKRPFRRIRTMSQRHLSRYTSHRAKAIDKLFSTVGIDGLCGRAQAELKRKNLLVRIDAFVDLRNEISHTGHLKADGRPRFIDPDKVRRQVEELEMFVSVSDKMIEKHFR